LNPGGSRKAPESSKTPLNLSNLRPTPVISVPITPKTRQSGIFVKPKSQIDLIGECHINFEKLLSNIISITSVEDNKDVLFGQAIE
jgi:hypothetical protein